MKQLCAVFVALCAIAAYGQAPSSSFDAPSGATADVDADPIEQYLGTWSGTMESPVTAPFPVTVTITEFREGKWCGTLQHGRPVDAEGKFLGVSMDKKCLKLAQTVFRGRDRCFDGLNMFVPVDENTLIRLWVDPETGKPRDKGLLTRVKPRLRG